ncbi:hypothetical protein SAMN06298212_1381, partial [Ruaniaceae bacterium KH17]
MKTSRLGRARSLAATLFTAIVVFGSLTVAPPAQAVQDPSPPPSEWAMPSEIPAVTPHITEGVKVNSLVEVGNKVIAGGPFTEVDGQPRTGVAAFDTVTGALDSAFNPDIVGRVEGVAVGPIPDTVYVVGAVSRVNGVGRSKIALINTQNGQLVESFKPPVFDNLVVDVKARNGTLYVAGYFETVGGQARGGLASLDALTGALTNQVIVHLTENHNTNPAGQFKRVGAAALDITKDGSRLIVVGNFRKANGLNRDQALQIDITGSTSSINAWQTNDFTALCYYWANASTVRSVALSPDDSFFVIGSGGGSNTQLCDTAARFKTDNPVEGARPEWVSSAGGDTIWGVAVTENAVYIGGHQRWMNNALGNDWAAPGAVPRSGISAVDPATGVPMKWNPGRVPRGTAVFSILATSRGIWIGSDTDYISVNPAYKRPKIAYFPYEGGYEATATTTPELPASVYVGRGGLGSPSNFPVTSVASWDFDGSTASAESAKSTAIDWSTVRGAFTVGDKLYVGTPNTLRVASFDGKNIGTLSEVNPYNDPKWMNWPNGSGGTYNGNKPNFYGTLSSVRGMFYDGGYLYYTTGSSTLYKIGFSPDSGIVAPAATAVSSSLNFSDVSGMFVDGDKLYHVRRSTGALYSIGWNGSTTTGSATLVNGPSNGGRNWEGRALFLGQTEANKPPVASFTSSCVGLTCTLDGSGSSDPDGEITAW